MRDYEQEYNDLMIELFEAHDAYRDLLGVMTFDGERGEKLNKMDLLRIAGWLWRLLDLELRLAGKWKRANGRAG